MCLSCDTEGVSRRYLAHKAKSVLASEMGSDEEGSRQKVVVDVWAQTGGVCREEGERRIVQRHECKS